MKNEHKNCRIEEKPFSPHELLELAVGYQKSHVLFTFVELEISKFLEAEPLNHAEIARRVKIHPLAAERFLNACVAVGLLQKEADVYKNSTMTERFLLKGASQYLGGQMQRYQKRSAPQWENLTGHLKNWKYGANADENPETDDQGVEAMAEQHNLALLHGLALAENFDFSPFSRLLDIGGGTGAMSIALCENFPDLRATIFDLPENIEKAKEMIARKNLQNQIECVGGDILKDDLPDNFDVALLANLLAVFDAETNKDLFQRIYEKLPVGGASLISGWILDEARTSPEIAVLFCLEDICWNASDVERAFTTYRDWLKDAGFKQIRVKTYFEPTKLISAFKK